MSSCSRRSKLKVRGHRLGPVSFWLLMHLCRSRQKFFRGAVELGRPLSCCPFRPLLVNGTNRQQRACSLYPGASSGATSLSASPFCTLSSRIAAAALVDNAQLPMALETLHQGDQCAASVLGLSRSCRPTGQLGQVGLGHAELTDKPGNRGRSRDTKLRSSRDVLLTLLAAVTDRRPSTHQKALVSSLPMTVKGFWHWAQVCLVHYLDFVP